MAKLEAVLSASLPMSGLQLLFDAVVQLVGNDGVVGLIAGGAPDRRGGAWMGHAELRSAA